MMVPDLKGNLEAPGKLELEREHHSVGLWEHITSQLGLFMARME